MTIPAREVDHVNVAHRVDSHPLMATELAARVTVILGPLGVRLIALTAAIHHIEFVSFPDNHRARGQDRWQSHPHAL